MKKTLAILLALTLLLSLSACRSSRNPNPAEGVYKATRGERDGVSVKVDERMINTSSPSPALGTFSSRRRQAVPVYLSQSRLQA